MSDENKQQNNSSDLPIKGAFKESLYRGSAKIRRDRADTILEDAQLRYKRKIEDIRQDITRLKRTRDSALDLAPDNALSLMHANNFNPEEFAKGDIETAKTLRNLTIELELAVERYEYLFGEEI